MNKKNTRTLVHRSGNGGITDRAYARQPRRKQATTEYPATFAEAEARLRDENALLRAELAAAVNSAPVTPETYARFFQHECRSPAIQRVGLGAFSS